MYLHYWHFANQWYMKINDNPEKIRIPSGNECSELEYKWKEEYLIKNSNGLTKRKIKEKLLKEYPNCILIKEIAFHEGARWYGDKNGSR